MKFIVNFLTVLFSSGLISAQNIHYKKGSERITVADNQILLNVLVSKKPSVFVLDFGTESMLTDSIRILKNQKIAIENGLFAGSETFLITAPADYNCIPGAINGRIGYDFFRKSQQIVEIDFDGAVLNSLNEIKQDYQEIQSNFRTDGIYITVMLKWKTYELKFDTGYTGTIFMSNKNAARFVKEACVSYENETGNYGVYLNKWITLGGNYYNSSITVADKGSSKIGMGFLKGFNWIIDFRKQKVYLRKNSISLEAENIFPPEYVAEARNGSLKITSKKVKSYRFQLEAIIEKVNGIFVTPENICEIEKLLSATLDWNVLDIQTKP